MIFRNKSLIILWGTCIIFLFCQFYSQAQNADQFIDQALVDSQHNKFADAIVDYTKAINLKPHEASAYYGRGSLYNDLYEYKEAFADFSKAIDIDKMYVFAYYKRGMIYSTQKNNLTLALADFNKAIAINPNIAQFYYIRGVVYFQLKKFDLSQADLKKAESLGFPSNSQLSNVLKESISKANTQVNL